jgi:DNA-directed RNA polymerase specialized sigma24 family protein
MCLPIDTLERDWQQALRSAELSASFRIWQTKKPILTRFAEPATVVSFARGSSSRADKDAVFGALLIWAKHEAIGARMVLEIIRPGLLNLSARIMRDSREREELCSMMFLAVWEAIRNYPLARRPRRIAANLLLDTLHQTLLQSGAESTWRARVSFASVEARDGPCAPEVDGDVDGLLDRAVRAGAVSGEEVELILSSRIDGVELADLARTTGISYNTIKLRRQRAERRLLLFLGYRPVPRRRQNRPSSLARVAGMGSQGPVGEKRPVE